MGIGFLTHLILDEIYSVDVMDTRIKASFGTALKLFDYRHLGHSAAMAAATVLVFLVTPPTRIFLESITSRTLWVGLNQRLLPQRTNGSAAWRGCSSASPVPSRAPRPTPCPPAPARSPRARSCRLPLSRRLASEAAARDGRLQLCRFASAGQRAHASRLPLCPAPCQN